MKRKEFVVFGVGDFGMYVAKTLDIALQILYLCTAITYGGALWLVATYKTLIYHKIHE